MRYSVHQGCVFSAHAEVVPILGCGVRHRWCILRARGGSSYVCETLNLWQMYSPRTRR